MKQIYRLLIAIAIYSTIQITISPLANAASTNKNNDSEQSTGIIRGIVTDKTTGELLIGATVIVRELQNGTTTGLDGSFILRNIPEGEYTLVGNFISYSPTEIPVTIAPENKEISVTLRFEPAAYQLGEVSVFAQRERSTEVSARASEKNSLTVMNIVSARAIEISPDLDVASVVQRISGVTLERNSSGDAQYAIMRGMDKRYNYTLVNGIKIPSPHNQHRFVPLNMFPSELVDRVEVTKSLTPDMEGDASGGVINIEMKDAPSGFTLQANTALGYNSFYLNNDFMYFPSNRIINASPREVYGTTYQASDNDFDNNWGALASNSPLPNGIAGLTIGNRFLNNRIGFIMAANYQNHHKGSSSIIYDDGFSQQQNTIIIGKMRERQYFENQLQYGLHGKADFRINNNNKLEWYNAFIRMENYGVRETTTTNFALNYDPENDRLDLSFQTRLRTNKQSILVSNLIGEHQLTPRMQLNWSGVYSVASHREPDKSYFNLDRIVLNQFDNIYPDADGSTREWAYNDDRDLAGYANLIHKSSVAGTSMTIKGGGLYRDKKRNNSQVEYRFRPNGSFIKGQNFNSLNEIAWALQNPRGSVGALEYDAHERIGAAYAMAHFSNSNGDLSFGVRAEYTDQGYFMYFPGPEHDANGGQKYVDVLPSVQVKHTPNEKTNIRLSYFQSINRPGFFEVVPYIIIAEDYLEFGNKNLKRAQIRNVDLRWEHFPKPTEQFMVGIFYKHLKNPIEMSYTTVNRRQYGYGPDNLGNAQNIGIEADVIKYMRNFGIKANYTYTLSAITTPKAYYGTDNNGNFALLFKDQTRPLAGQSPHVANLSLLYKDTRFGWDAQIAAAYTHDKIIIASRFYDSDYWQASSMQFDASFEKQFKGGVSLFGKINNILDTPLFNYIRNTTESNSKLPGQDKYNERALIRQDIYGRSFLLGIRYKHQ